MAGRRWAGFRVARLLLMRSFILYQKLIMLLHILNLEQFYGFLMEWPMRCGRRLVIHPRKPDKVRLTVFLNSKALGSTKRYGAVMNARSE